MRKLKTHEIAIVSGARASVNLHGNQLNVVMTDAKDEHYIRFGDGSDSKYVSFSGNGSYDWGWDYDWCLNKVRRSDHYPTTASMVDGVANFTVTLP
jgi:hypothetical protein